MSSALPVLALGVLAVVSSVLLPRLLPRLSWLRRTPAAALTLWQVAGLTGVSAALLTAPAAALSLVSPDDAAPTVLDGPLRLSLVLAVAVALSGGMAVLLLRSGHLVGRSLRSNRREQRHVVDVVASRTDGRLRVLDHPGRSAYCLPGLQSRVVLTQGAVNALSAAELDAVLAHEHAHVRSRHDLMLEFFTVLHRTVPARVRSEPALAEVHLLIELLADRQAARRVGVSAMGGALVTMAGQGHPRATLSDAAAEGDAAVRIRALPGHLRFQPTVFAVALAAIVLGLLPWALLAWALWA
ncbi:M56 family metallopeptidase [Ornithinimicrobium cavernae]|uniref:M56 family metallopeptidase n=1 Tax=Ornithinimicrobium cavernae TaxID=2666047 RepID=UPI000D69500D|nr:M56 family metallopeptidase [Ornithinimicrobium cavernae]